LYYYRARYYSPELQRFISEDPIRLAGGDVNYYAYVGNNPVNWIDPLGLFGTEHPLVTLAKSGPTHTDFTRQRDVKPVIELGKDIATIARGIKPIVDLFLNPKRLVPIIINPKLFDPPPAEACP
jgi:uncharacterized protein RhaS with RHS repeats